MVAILKFETERRREKNSYHVADITSSPQITFFNSILILFFSSYVIRLIYLFLSGSRLYILKKYTEKDDCYGVAWGLHGAQATTEKVD